MTDNSRSRTSSQLVFNCLTSDEEAGSYCSRRLLKTFNVGYAQTWEVVGPGLLRCLYNGEEQSLASDMSNMSSKSKRIVQHRRARFVI